MSRFTFRDEELAALSELYVEQLEHLVLEFS